MGSYLIETPKRHFPAQKHVIDERSSKSVHQCGLGEIPRIK